MAAISTKFKTSGTITFSGDSVFVNFDDGSSLEFEGAASLQQWVLENTPDLQGLRAMAIGNRLALDPLLDSPSVWDGKTFTLDVEQPVVSNVFKVAG